MKGKGYLYFSITQKPYIPLLQKEKKNGQDPEFLGIPRFPTQNLSQTRWTDALNFSPYQLIVKPDS